jgi:mono/diheme cytochrome c family protein
MLALFAIGGAAAQEYVPPAAPEAPGDALEGRRMAVEFCSACHRVDSDPRPSPVADAPRFATFKERWPLDNLEEALAEGIMVSHPEYPMPVFQFEPDEIADLIAYLDTLSDAEPEDPDL